MVKQVSLPTLPRSSILCMRSDSQRSMSSPAGLGAGGLGGPGLIMNPGMGADAKSRKYGKKKTTEGSNIDTQQM